MFLVGYIKSRVSGFLTIFDALFYYYVLKLPIFRHQYISLIIIGICLILVIITEFIFQKFNISNLWTICFSFCTYVCSPIL